jgi:hypothetical protein
MFNQAPDYHTQLNDQRHDALLDFKRSAKKEAIRIAAQDTNHGEGYLIKSAEDIYQWLIKDVSK